MDRILLGKRVRIDFAKWDGKRYSCDLHGSWPAGERSDRHPQGDGGSGPDEVG